KGSEDKTKLAGALNLLMKGNAFIYYGEELGMKGSGKDENKRAPMQWTADANAEGMCDGPKDMEEVKMKYPALDEQQEDLFSIYNYFKNAIRLRNLYPVISRGNTTPIEELSGKEICAFVRSVTEEEEQEYLTASGDNDSGLFGPTQLLFIINTSGEEQTVDLSVAAEADAFTAIDYQLITSQVHASIENRTVTMPAYGIVIMR
ncbi:MAG: alpha-amylase, partial [Lachnospiraceae bacterium]|nr:alpha-amylase [Lachnospiraceae bacterium]